jgi:hypothetical protein
MKRMSSNTDQESVHRLLLTQDSYINPRAEHKSNKMKIRLIIVFIIMLFFSLLISSVDILARTAPIERSDSTTTFSTDK